MGSSEVRRIVCGGPYSLHLCTLLETAREQETEVRRVDNRGQATLCSGPRSAGAAPGEGQRIINGMKAKHDKDITVQFMKPNDVFSKTAAHSSTTTPAICMSSSPPFPAAVEAITHTNVAFGAAVAPRRAAEV
ncbi:hypothetical protein MSAN_00761400 [Mycena sanguinolenta]|uniref:Uncharacterized protein n=1 Tax=Mycena sanguinolenta TaxID=230812 RepID=A0A8H6Z7J6_9AGAR|nr:hypothetical protein MSAN_00761400 [Mycena sanguinolenta]